MSKFPQNPSFRSLCKLKILNEFVSKTNMSKLFSLHVTDMSVRAHVNAVRIVAENITARNAIKRFK